MKNYVFRIYIRRPKNATVKSFISNPSHDFDKMLCDLKSKTGYHKGSEAVQLGFQGAKTKLTIFFIRGMVDKQLFINKI